MDGNHERSPRFRSSQLSIFDPQICSSQKASPRYSLLDDTLPTTLPYPVLSPMLLSSFAPERHDQSQPSATSDLMKVQSFDQSSIQQQEQSNHLLATVSQHTQPDWIETAETRLPAPKGPTFDDLFTATGERLDAPFSARTAANKPTKYPSINELLKTADPDHVNRVFQLCGDNMAKIHYFLLREAGLVERREIDWSRF